MFSDRVIYYLPKEKRSQFQKLLINLESNFKKFDITHITVQGAELIDAYTTIITKERALVDPLSANVMQSLDNVFKNRRNQNTLQPHSRCALLFKKRFFQYFNAVPNLIIIAAITIILFQKKFIQSEPYASGNNIVLGISNQLSSEFNKCRYLEITELPNIVKVNKGVSEKHLKCGTTPFRTSRGKYIGRSYGAVEKDSEKYIIWAHEAFFHSSALSLNLAHNWALR